MSVSMYQGQVDRLNREIADLEAKQADERIRAAREHEESLRAQGSITKSTSPSSAASKMRDAQRREGQAVGHDKKAAELGKRVASKRDSLRQAAMSLDRALTQERQKTEREDRRRREADMRRIQDLEHQLRAATKDGLSQVHLARASSLGAATGEGAEEHYEYDVCLSFAGEDRPYVEMIAAGLKAHGVKVFYDQDETANLWGKDLAEHLDHVYRVASRYCVIFISEAYARKAWTRHERRSALARAVDEAQEYVLPARFDDTELPGLRPTTAYLDLRKYAPDTLVSFLLEKLGMANAAAQ